MLARAAFLLRLGGLTGGVVLLGVALVSQQAALAIAGGLALAAGGASHEWLRRHGRLASAAEGFDRYAVMTDMADDTHLAQLMNLLHEWDALERRRGLAGFDPWALQATRNDIHALVASDPALDRLFRAHDRAA